MKLNTSHWIDQNEIISYLVDVRRYETLSKEQEVELLVKIRNGCQKSRDKLITSNLRFVISVAKNYQNQGLPFLDLISEGNYGLLKAAEKFDYTQNEVRFLSYAVWWIKQSILSSLHDNSRTIRFPVNVINELNKMRKAKVDEYNEQEVENPVKAMALPTVDRMDQPYDEEGGTMHDVIEDKSCERPDMRFADDKIILSQRLKLILSNLNTSEQYVITKYFGLDCDQLTLQDISEDMQLTKERVRQIKEKAIKKLRFYSKELFELL